MQRIVATALAVLLVVGSAAPIAGAAATSDRGGASLDESAQSEAYAGSHVSFQASGDAIANYSVDGTEVFASVQTQSQDQYHAQSGIDVGVSLSAVTDVAGVDLSVDASTETRAEIQTEGSASMTAHDSNRGILTVNAGSEAQYVEVDLASGAEAESESDSRVVVDSGNRTGAFVVVGDGEVAVNEEGSVTADLASNSTLVFRSYEGERGEDEREQEQLIAEGTATAEVYADEQDGERVADVATYGQDIAVETSTEAEGRLNMTVERATSEGTVVIASVSEAVVGSAESADDVTVTVDGEAAAQASSYSELRGGIGEEPRYMVTSSSQASASADVLVAVDHFSERQVAVQGSDDGADGSSSGSSSDGGSSDGGDGDGSGGGNGMPGFGVVVALLALLSVAAARSRVR